jgi:hypothetical protein
VNSSEHSATAPGHQRVNSDYHNTPRGDKKFSTEAELFMKQLSETIEQGVSHLNKENVDEALKLF